MKNIIWIGKLSDSKVENRIVQCGVDDCVVEFKGDNGWEVLDDDRVASHVYITALLELHCKLSKVNR